MDFSWSKFRLPRPWSRGRVNREHQTEDGSPVFTPEASCPVLDLSHESQREDDCHERSPAERASILQRMSEQLMLACAQECPELQEKIDVASAHLFAVTNELTERNQAGLQRQSRHVSIPLPEHLSQTDELLGAVAAEDNVHMEYVDPVHESVSSGYSLTEPDIGVFSVNTPFHDGIPSARFVHQSTTRANTCTTVTVTVGRPLMSSHLYSPPVSDVGTQMVEETSLHGRIWIPSSYSTPAVQKATGQYSNRIGPQNHVNREPDSQHWRLVSDDRPSNGGQQCVDQGERYGRVQFGTQYQWPTDQPHVPGQCHGVMQHDTVVGSRATPPNRPSLSYEAWVSEMEPLLRQAFEAGRQSTTELNPTVCMSDGMSEFPQTRLPMQSREEQWRGAPVGSTSKGRRPVGGLMMPAGEEPTQVAATEATSLVATSGATGATQRATLGPSRISPDCQGYGAPGTSSVVEPMGLSPTTVPHNATPSVSPAIVRPKKVAKYDGKTSWADYLVQFNIAARLNSWDDSQKAMELATSLEGNARAILADLSPDQQLNFEALVGKLTQRFEPEGQLGIYQSQLQSRRRKRSESIPELIQEISRLVRKAYPAADDQTRSYMAVSSFISALGNEAQELFVYQKDPKNLEEAGRAALSFETFRAARAKDAPSVRVQQSGNLSSDPPKWAQDWMTKIEKMERQLSNWNRKPGKGRGTNLESVNSRARRPGSCYHCGVTGHWARECPQKGTPALQPSPIESEPSGSNFEEIGQQASQSPGPQKKEN